jgi:hypothetical protein
MTLNGRHRKRASLGLAALAGAAAVAAAVVAFSGGNGEASAAESCQGLDTALRNNLDFIAQQQAAPDAQSAARIANREAVVDQLQQRRQVAGCTGELVAAPIDTGSGESCTGLDTALRNNLDFIAQQQAAPDAQSAARIENRQAVVDLIQQRRQAAGCTADVQPPVPAETPAPPPVTSNPAPPAATSNPAPPAATSNPAPPAATSNPAPPPAAGDVVCDGSTVTLSGEDGAPAASSNQFPAGTRLKVTNLDNDKSITVEVTGVSGSCVLLNDAAFEQVREPGKFLIRRAVIERVG